MISEGSSDGVIVESDGSVRGADLIISTGSPRVNQDFVSWQVETGLGFRWDEEEERGGGFPAEEVATAGRATSGGSDGASASAAAAPGCLGRHKLPLC